MPLIKLLFLTYHNCLSMVTLSCPRFFTIILSSYYYTTTVDHFFLASSTNSFACRVNSSRRIRPTKKFDSYIHVMLNFGGHFAYLQESVDPEGMKFLFDECSYSFNSLQYGFL